MMRHRLRRLAVVLTLIVSLMLIASHAYLLHETPAQQGVCPCCQWLQNLSHGGQPAILVLVSPLAGESCQELALASSQTLRVLPFSARSPPNA